VAADLEQGLEDLARLEQAIKQHKLKPRVPSVVVLFRDNLKLTLGDIFGGILSRTVEKEEDVGASGRKQGQGSSTRPAIRRRKLPASPPQGATSTRVKE